MVWKWAMKYRPISGCSRPESSSSRGVSMAPAATITCRAARKRSAPSGPTRSTPVARRPSTRMRATKVSDSSSARPVAMVRRSMATGSPLAWIGQPKKEQKPQLLQAGRPS